MFSRRLDWYARPNRLSQLLAEKRVAGAEILDLTESNPTRAGFHYPDELLRSFHDLRALRYDPSPQGLRHAREAVARVYGVDPGRVILTASTSEAYSWLFKLLCNPGDVILAPRPSYPLFDYLAALESVRVAYYPLFYDGCWSMDLGALESLVNERVRVLVLVNPNNPTGSFLKAHEYPALVEIARRCNLALISDEVFQDYSFITGAGCLRTLAAADEALAFCLGGLSKACGLPQMKAGWILVAGPNHLADKAIENLLLIADTYLSVSAPVQYALPALLDSRHAIQAQIRRRTHNNLQTLQSLLAGSALRVLTVEGGWYATVQLPRVLAEEEWAARLLLDYSTWAQPGYFYDFATEAFLVLSLLTPESSFQEGVRRLLALAQRTLDG